MSTFNNVTPKNALLFAMKAYDNPQCMSVEEFHEDYKRFKYIKRLCRRYASNTRVSERLMLNHLVLLTNVFGVEPTCRLLFVKCEEDEKVYRVLKPFLMYLKMLPEIVWGVNGKNILTDKIPLDEKLYRKLKEL
jgi:hypothetical protein